MNKYLSLPLTLAILAFVSCSKKEDNASKEDKQENIPTVKVETVNARVVNQIGTYTATVEAQSVNNISANLANRIKEIYVDEGQFVAAGQKIALLDDVNTFNYETQVNNARANVENVQLNYNRAVELLKIGGGTQQNVDAMQIQLTNAKNQLSQAERTLRNAKENTVLTTPISGVVTARNYDPGDMTGALPIITVAKVQPVKVVINVTESELPHVTQGMPAVIKFDTYGDQEFKGTVTTIMPTIDPQTRTFAVEVTMPNTDNKARPGMFGRVTLNLGSQNRVVIPDKAVVKQQGSGNQYVYVLNPDGSVTFKQVELGQRLGDEYELISGVESGSQVVVSGQAKLSNGIKVRVTK